MNRRTKQNTKSTRRQLLTAEQKYFLLQKGIGIIAIIVGFLGSIVMEDATPFFLFASLGAAFLFSKDKILMVTDVYWEENPVNRNNYPKK